MQLHYQQRLNMEGIKKRRSAGAFTGACLRIRCGVLRFSQ